MESLKIKNGWIITQNPDREIIRGDILIDGGKIAGIGEINQQADKEIDAEITKHQGLI